MFFFRFMNYFKMQWCQTARYKFLKRLKQWDCSLKGEFSEKQKRSMESDIPKILFSIGCLHIQNQVPVFTWSFSISKQFSNPNDPLSSKLSCNPSQKSLATLRRKPSPASPLSMLLQWCRLFFRYFFEPAKQHWAGGTGEKKAIVQCYCLRL